MSSSQGMGTIRKNSMVLENEYMQVHTPFSPSTNQVKQGTKEVETMCSPYIIRKLFFTAFQKSTVYTSADAPTRNAFCYLFPAPKGLQD
ncbi:hypothetical protein FXO37_27450 [Capsicum annuum]|nr:hypothetical protein FXO37_27450 [Capsicum annuum]